MGWVNFYAGHHGVPAWYQDSWAVYVPQSETLLTCDGDEVLEDYCGSAYCACGYALYQTGNTLTMREVYDTFTPEAIEKLGYPSKWTASEERGDFWRQEIPNPNMVGFDGNVVSTDGTQIGWQYAGQAILGLTEYETDRLFAGENDADDINEYAEAIAASRGLELYPKEDD